METLKLYTKRIYNQIKDMFYVQEICFFFY